MTSSNCVCDRKAVSLFFSDSSTSFDLEEQIEMVPFQEVEGAGRGEGHEWGEGGSHNPTWCDLCGELIWGLYDTGYLVYGCTGYWYRYLSTDIDGTVFDTCTGILFS